MKQTGGAVRPSVANVLDDDNDERAADAAAGAGVLKQAPGTCHNIRRLMRASPAFMMLTSWAGGWLMNPGRRLILGPALSPPGKRCSRPVSTLHYTADGNALDCLRHNIDVVVPSFPCTRHATAFTESSSRPADIKISPIALFHGYHTVIRRKKRKFSALI